MDGGVIEVPTNENDYSRYTFRKYMSKIYNPMEDRLPIWYILYWENHPHNEEDVRWGIRRFHVPAYEFHMIEPEHVRYELFRSMMAYLLMTHDHLVKWYWEAYPLNYGTTIDCQETFELLKLLARLGIK